MEGRLTSLLDPGQGMNLDSIGRENIRLRGYFHGMTKADVMSLEADVEDFAEIGEIPRPSSMKLLIRHGRAPGLRNGHSKSSRDTAHGRMDPPRVTRFFMEKAKRRMEAMEKGAADILILASHSSGIISEWCNRVIWLEQGKVVADGNPLEILLRYLPKGQLTSKSADGQVQHRP